MALAHWQRWLPLTRKLRKETKPEMLTLEDLKASIGKGPAADLSDCTFHASTEDFIAEMKAQHAQRCRDRLDVVLASPFVGCLPDAPDDLADNHRHHLDETFGEQSGAG